LRREYFGEAQYKLSQNPIKVRAHSHVIPRQFVATALVTEGKTEMNWLARLIKQHSLIAFFLLAFALSGGLVLLAGNFLAFALLALFGPAAAAIIVTGITEGKSAVRALLQRVVHWRVGPIWYVVAIGLPAILFGAVVGLHLLLGGSFTFQPGNAWVLTLILAVLVIGEEIGWRGFALPRLQLRYNSLVASLILGLLWGAGHLVNATIPGLSYYWTAFPAFLLWIIALTILFTWIANHTGGSVLLAWLFHAATNTFAAIFSFGDPARQWWLGAAVFWVAALILIAVTGPNLTRRPAAQAVLGTMEV
jgi:membrane protease YdiL (CAAX protease family)